MIITVTMNPSIDISYPLETLKLDTVNRVVNTSKTAGGKGLNVTRVVHELSGQVLATGLLGGHHGAFIQTQLDQEGIAHDFSAIAGETRNSIAILHDNGHQTEILEAGPNVSEIELAQFEEKFDLLLKQANLVTLSGSLAKGIPTTYYSHLIAKAYEQGVKVLLDTSGASLKASLESPTKPFLIKPNTEEIFDLVGQTLSLEDLPNFKAVLSSDLFAGVEWIVVSLGSKGAFVKHHNRFYQVTIPKIAVVNPVGSGDSTIAGLAYAIDQGKNDEEILQYAMVCGMLNAQEAKTGHINVENLPALKAQIVVKEV
ncbi:tagatose-6-phosphate kinase [Enterococcus lemanii]|uniref:Tagatose-6-phosphate kinase n=1 Tax=Enterococcus lemanii TaxID=1159752 RepID=A0ABV9MRR2_9ENTE|nr:tagatose-6-phosphate kinase [Enterococcus lemanii]MBM7709126.1 tagatose 6-phosphate kinase [Enterococcus lemanii]